MSIKHSRIQGLLKKSLLGEELIDTQFHLFSSRSRNSRKICRPRALFANNVLLSESSDYFASLLNSNNQPANRTLIDFDGDHPIYNETSFKDYGYASDSDLEEDEDDPSIRAIVTPDFSRISISQGKSSRSEDYSDDVGDDVDSCMSQESLEGDYDISEDAQDIFMGRKSIASLDVPPPQMPIWGRPHAVPIARYARSRKIFVKDTAFNTWQALLFYLYTDKIKFKPLKSEAPVVEVIIDGEAEVTPSFLSAIDYDPLPCSPKSMYRLASKIGLESLKNLALAAIRAGLSDRNVIHELASSLTATYPEILTMQLDVLLRNFSSRFVEDGLPNLAKQISRGEHLQGEKIIMGIHQRVLRDYYPSAPPTLRASDLQWCDAAPTSCSSNESYSKAQGGKKGKCKC